MAGTVIYIVKGLQQYAPSWIHSLWYDKDKADETVKTLTEMAEAEENNDDFFFVDEHKVSDG